MQNVAMALHLPADESGMKKVRIGTDTATLQSDCRIFERVSDEVPRESYEAVLSQIQLRGNRLIPIGPYKPNISYVQTEVLI